uniref:Uncharacterized protein n=1 Tax=Hyaloperonospora arabidopsidis (strain Emoy2) TaxID=559515 RepID=M4BXX0_HYAAE
MREGLTSRQQLIHANQVTLREECLIQEGRRLERTTDRLRWDFKRVFDWERDQTVTDLHQLYGEAFSRHATIADKFATELQPVLGRVTTQPHRRLCARRLMSSSRFWRLVN